MKKDSDSDWEAMTEMTEEDIKEFEEARHLFDETQAINITKYHQMSLEEQIDRYEESHKKPEIWNKLKKYYVKPHQILNKLQRSELISVIENASNEEEIQKYIQSKPFILTTSISPAHHGQVCIPKPEFGNQLIPDFLIAGVDSGGFWWYGVELESPKHKMFTKNGEETRELKHAIRQIQDWRVWLKTNISYARETLGFVHIDADLPCFIIIGKRENEILSESDLMERRQRVKNSDKQGLFLHHYEWLIDKPQTIVRVDDIGD